LEQKPLVTPLTTAEVKEILSALEGGQLDQIQKRTADYVTAFSKFKPEEAKKIKAALVKEVGLTLEEACEVINISPGSVDELRSLLAGWKRLLPAESMKKILDLLS
jgi:DNA-directed RNA polymerase subunit F